MAIDEQRLAALRAAKLTALVAGISGVPKQDLAPRVSASTMASVVGCVAMGRAYALAESIGDLGPALHWFVRRQAAEPLQGLTILADGDQVSDLARRAAPLLADVVVLRITGQSVETVEPAPPTQAPELPDALWRAAAVIVEAGIGVLDDHGRLCGEVNGLEIARVEPSPADSHDDQIVLQVGVGQADRELHGYVHGHLSDAENLRRAATLVAEHRKPGAGFHPLNVLARPRWLRSILINDPSLLGLGDLEGLEPQSPLRPNPGVFDNEPSAAFSPGHAAGGQNSAAPGPVTVVCSAGVDLDLIPEALDYRLRIDPESKLVLVLPVRDVKLATWGVIELVENVQLCAIEPPW